ncbi:MAG TPA: DUF6036 family nucleotidyltransferase [Anaerolineae bacterium]|nr:DUF6036 family nucleotidyltransferase [Anaerolineae bacterium]
MKDYFVEVEVVLEISTPRLLAILNPKIERTMTLFTTDEQLPSSAEYWMTRPGDERIAALIATVGGSNMQPTLDMLEFIGYLNQYDVRYLVIGGYALAFHGHPRYTKDIDIWIERTVANSRKLADALQDFGILFDEEAQKAFVNGGPIRIGWPPNLIDIVGVPHGVVFDDVYEEREKVDFEGLEIVFIGKDGLIANKRATGRLQDLADIEAIEGTG